MVHQPGAEEDQGDRAQQHQQQLAVVERQVIGGRAYPLDHAAAGEEGEQGDHQADPAQVVGHCVAVVIGHHGSQRQGDERTDVDRHVEQGEGAIQPGITGLVALGEQAGGVGLEQAVADGDGAQCIEDEVGVVDGHAGHEVADDQYDGPQHHGALGPQNMVTHVTAHRDEAVHQRREGTEGDEGLLLGKAQLLDEEHRQQALDAVIAEALPELDEEDHEKGFWLLQQPGRGGWTHANLPVCMYFLIHVSGPAAGLARGRKLAAAMQTKGGTGRLARMG